MTCIIVTHQAKFQGASNVVHLGMMPLASFPHWRFALLLIQVPTDACRKPMAHMLNTPFVRLFLNK